MTALWDRRKDALDYAHAAHLGPLIWDNDCQKFVRMAANAPGGIPSAKASWQQLPAADRHGVGHKRPPAGVPAWFRTSSPFWHVVLSAGKGKCWSTDILRTGGIDLVNIEYIERHWGAVYLGWGETINGRRLWPAT